MSDTIFFHLQLKRTRTPEEVFTNMTKKIKKKGPTKNWTYTVEDDYMVIDFNDDGSETFYVEFIDKAADGSCKVDFQLGGEGCDDSFDKCVLAYQYFVSIFEYSGFKRVEKMNFPEECYDRTL